MSGGMKRDFPGPIATLVWLDWRKLQTASAKGLLLLAVTAVTGVDRKATVEQDNVSDCILWTLWWAQPHFRARRWHLRAGLWLLPCHLQDVAMRRHCP